MSAAVGVAAAAVSQLELTRWVTYKLRGASGAAGALENPGRVLATANALTTLGTICAAAAIPALLARTTPTVLGIVTLALGVPLLVSAAYLVPRVVGRRWAEPIVAHAVPRLHQLGTILAPFVAWRDPSKRTALAAVLSNADTEALASADEMAVVSGVLAFADRPVKELMTPRTAIVAIPEGLLAAEAAHVCAQSGYSRYPVYRGSLDDVVGVAHAFDLLALQPDAPVPVRPALVVPATTRAADLMLEMQRGRSHLAVVLDEFGGTAGVVTLEDLLRDLVEEIFGERAAAPAAAPAPPAGVLEVEANAPLGRIEAAFGVGLASPGVQSVGGLLIQALGRIPRPGAPRRHHRPARRGQEHPDRAPDPALPGAGAARGRDRRGPDEPLHGRGPVGRPHPHGVREPRPGGVHPLDGHAGGARRPRDHDRRGGRPARGLRLRPDPHRDRRCRADRAGRRPHRGDDRPGARPRVGRRHPDAQGRRNGDCGRLCDQQERPAGRGQAAHGGRGDAGDPAGECVPPRRPAPPRGRQGLTRAPAVGASRDRGDRVAG